MWASQTPGVRNASVEFDEQTLRPTYRLILGTAGSSSGIEIARKMQVSEEILAQAQAMVDPGHAQATEYLRRLKAILEEQENLRAALEKERLDLAQARARLQADYKKKEEARKKEFESALQATIDEFRAESEQAIRVIKERVEAARLRRAGEKQAAQLRKKAAALIAAAWDEKAASAGASRAAPVTAEDLRQIQPGDRVKIRSLDREGIVESVSDETCVVRIGPLRYRAEPSDLMPDKGTSAAPEAPGAGRFEESFADPEAMTELKIIGLTADEALPQVDRLLDQALLKGIEKVHIIHGHGKGILRRSIAQFLSTHPVVERFYPAPPEKGGSGATIVELKK